ncbi:hypothetical protein GCM10008904_30140 [Paraclostridium ghonii]|uniref:Glycosyltransferase involved in cell wall biosynthesis n=1 Tax=Paraclostridium ghonii TaxID=29358 RepID=A0ABU0MXE6_9FIRM|nr:glycosyltransferase [Paeniclostridium ghonii]MDQ0555583.1 glycosyltransferase involved in cell wall biosynthesis [Paeniclostridium ghonii]
MKIMMLMDQFTIGGTETHVLTLCDTLKKFNIKTIILTFYENKNTFTDKNKSVINNINKNKELSNIENLINIVNLYKIDLIHCHSIESMKLARQLFDVTNTPYIITVHGLYYPKDALQYACKKAKHIIVVSKPVKNLVLECIGIENIDKISVIYNGVKIKKDYLITNNYNLKNKLGIPNNAKVILYCSRLSFTKGRLAEIFIHQIKNLLKDNIYIIIIGDGIKKKSIDFYANQINNEYKENRIITLGNIYNVNSFYGISDIVVGTGRVAIEALNFSKPVICFGMKGYLGILKPTNKEEVLDTYFGDHGYNDNIEKLNIEKSIKYLLENQDEYKKISNWGKLYCDNNFDLEKLTIKYISIIS